MAAEGLPVEVTCRVLGVSESGYYAWRSRAPSARAVRHDLLTELIRKVHSDSRCIYGYRRVHAELTLGHGLTVGHEAVYLLMRRAGIEGISGRPRYRRIPNVATASDQVDRQFHRDHPDQLWVTDITEHPTREGKVYCTVVLDVFSRRVVGWSIDSSPTASLVTNALGMAIQQRQPAGGTVIHSDQGTQFTSWAFTRRALDSGLVPSMGSVGDCFDNAVIESFWSRMQVELLDRQKWRTRVELANAIFEYLEIFHNRQRRHSALGMLSPVQFEAGTNQRQRHDSSQPAPRNPGQLRASIRPRAIHVAEIGVDMSRFPTASHLASWAGLCLGNHESAGKRSSGRARKGNGTLRAAMCEAAWAASHTRDSYLAAQYRRFKRRFGTRSEGKAMFAVAHTMIVIVWQVLSVDDHTYKELGADYFDRRSDAEARKRYLVRELERLGQHVTLQPAA